MPGSAAPAVRLTGLTKRFGGARGVAELELEVQPGQVFGFLGPNGAGKSTTIRLMMGLYRPDTGRAEILGTDAPDHLVMAGRLRVANRQASLEELGQLADPPLTKDAIAGRIRRLLAMADRRATDLGLPSTEACLTADMLP